MRKKTVSMIFAGLTAVSGILPHAPKIIPEGNSLITAAAVAATLSIPSKSVAAIMPARIVQIAAISMSRNCEAGVMDQLCSSVTSFLADESAKADADAKACKKNCGWKKRKDDLLDAAKKKAKESCAKGEAPDAQELSKGLDRNTKDRLKDLYDRNSRMFDGTAKLAAKYLEPVPSNSAATLTGKGGQVTDLKTAEPATPKLNIASEFGLSGTKLSRELPAQAKQNAVLPASASPAKASADTASVLPAKSTSDTAASANNALSLQKAVAASDPIIPMVRECKCYYGGLFLEVGEAGIPGSVCQAWKTKNCCPQNQTMAATGCSASCKAGTGFWGFYTNWRRDSAGDTSNCGSECFNPGTKCCLASKAVGDKCGATCYDPKTDCCVDGKKQEGSSTSCKCQRIDKRIKGVEGIIAGYNEGQEPKGVSYAHTTCADDETGNLVGTPVYHPAFYDLAPELKEAVIKHEEIHKQQCETDGWLKWIWRNRFDKSLLEIPAYQREKIILEKTFREQCGK